MARISRVIARCMFELNQGEGERVNFATCRVDTCTSLLPDGKPRYVMGVVSLLPRLQPWTGTDNTRQGYPEDLVVSVALGADMFDCVWPTRTAVSHLLLSAGSFSDGHH